MNVDSHNLPEVQITILKDYADKLIEPYAAAFNVVLEGLEPITFWDMFLERYKTSRLLYLFDSKRVITQFVRIFKDNEWKLEQLNQYQYAKNKLVDFNNWADTTDSINYVLNVSRNLNTDSRATLGRGETSLDNSSISANSDSNSLNTEIDIVNDIRTTNFPVNMYTKNKQDSTDRTNNDTVSAGSSKGDSNSISVYNNRGNASNLSKDLRNFFLYDMPKIRERFLGSFRSMFIARIC